jgi:hypothetical protein
VTAQQLAVLNSLVTYAMENMPGEPSEDEREVARIVGAACLIGDDTFMSRRNDVPCTCAIDHPAGDPEDHGAHCLWATSQILMDDVTD